MTRFTSLLLAAATVATVVGFATPGEARDWRHGNRCDWVYGQQSHPGFGRHGRLQQFQFGNVTFGWHQRRLAPGQIRRALHQQGFDRIRGIEFHRGVYRALAVARHRGPQQVFVHAANGRVLCVSRIGPHRPSYRDTIRGGHDRDHDRDRDRRFDRERHRR